LRSSITNCVQGSPRHRVRLAVSTRMRGALPAPGRVHHE
jgi:hypothetical protein